MGAVAPAALATAALAGLSAHAQTPEGTRKAEHDQSASDPGPENKALVAENPNSNMPPPTDHGDLGPVWYSFDLAYKRVQEGGWTHQVTQRELPSSKEISGVNMRLTSGSFRELHWHTSDEWAIMLYGNARVSCLNTDGTIFIDDVGQGDLWYFPTGYPHSIQGLGPDGCEFLLVFDDGLFSENDTFLLSDWVRQTPTDVLSQNFGLDAHAARTMDFHANDVGYVPVTAGHYIQNTGDTDLVFLEMFKANEFVDVSLNNGIRHLPPEMVTSHLNLDENAIKKIPSEKMGLIPA